MLYVIVSAHFILNILKRKVLLVAQFALQRSPPFLITVFEKDYIKEIKYEMKSHYICYDFMICKCIREINANIFIKGSMKDS